MALLLFRNAERLHRGEVANSMGFPTSKSCCSLVNHGNWQAIHTGMSQNCLPTLEVSWFIVICPCFPQYLHINPGHVSVACLIAEASFRFLKKNDCLKLFEKEYARFH